MGTDEEALWLPPEAHQWHKKTCEKLHYYCHMWPAGPENRSAHTAGSWPYCALSSRMLSGKSRFVYLHCLIDRMHDHCTEHLANTVPQNRSYPTVIVAPPFAEMRQRQKIWSWDSAERKASSALEPAFSAACNCMSWSQIGASIRDVRSSAIPGCPSTRSIWAPLATILAPLDATSDFRILIRLLLLSNVLSSTPTCVSATRGSEIVGTLRPARRVRSTTNFGRKRLAVKQPLEVASNQQEYRHDDPNLVLHSSPKNHNRPHLQHQPHKHQNRPSQDPTSAPPSLGPQTGKTHTTTDLNTLE